MVIILNTTYLKEVNIASKLVVCWGEYLDLMDIVHTSPPYFL